MLEVFLQHTADDEGTFAGCEQLPAGAEAFAFKVSCTGFLARFVSLRLSLASTDALSSLQQIQLGSVEVRGRRANLTLKPIGWVTDGALLRDTLSEAPIMNRSMIVPGWFEAGRGGGTIVEVGLPSTMSWISGFRIRYASDAPQLSQQAAAMGGTRMELEAFIVRVTIFQEQDQGDGSGRRMSSGTIGEFLIPCCDPSVNMHFDFKKPVSGRVFIFEVVGSQRKGSTGSVEESRAVSASAREFEGMHNFVKAMAASVRLYRYTIAQQ